MSDKLIPDGSGGFHLPGGGRLTPDGMGGFHILGGGAGDGCAAGLAGIMAIPMLILTGVISLFVAPGFVILPIIALLTQGMLGRPLTPDETGAIIAQGGVAITIFWVIVIAFVVRHRAKKG
ncbi:MAG: hypothetical protein AAB973_00470 [Patescibacteria group bacterium]